jgi:ribosomal protein S18 acetylase RimI-like enzyme
MKLQIRNGKAEDLDECFILERSTFPECEAASKENIKIRLSQFSDGFIVGEIDGKIIAHINSGSTNKDDITDEEFKSLIGHESGGKNIVIFSVAVNPEYQKMGIASKMMSEFIKVSKKIKKKNILLICKENLIGMYEKMGYEKNGISASTHGGAVWYEMIYSL